MALATLVYVVALAFEARAASIRPALSESFDGSGAAAFSSAEFVAHVEWRVAVFLLIGGCAAACLVASTSIAAAVRQAPWQVGSMGALVSFMTESAYTWLLALMNGVDGSGAAGLDGLVAAGTLSAGAYYSLMFAAIYLPAAAALEVVGRRLGAAASAAADDPDAWLERNGLSISWSGQLARLGTLLAPLASSAVVGVFSSGV
ncbi:hypothetical protein [Engelhardtia mirabilis]|uniref:Uncharacterized protein n=1 Tax=Engelhardtia mirabilis TaxID=2528011 RepID=A0A518BGU0_9BACT|nr:hypothetical protein Pla133_12420 [Planctomycetes bacterium Pla133]QDV00503.1 hypothetical protein Pla86_12420 [Planctomycetes bacterium Pla86]